MRLVLVVVGALTILLLQDVAGQTCSGPIRGTIEGNITLGFLFPFRGSQQGSSSCSSEVVDLSNIQLLEAARFALQNAQNTIPGVTIGLEAYDNCGSSKVGIEQTVSFLSDRSVLVDNQMSSCSGSTIKPGMVVGGGLDIMTSVGPFISDAHLPLIGYDTTLSEFTSSERYSYFIRTLPSDQNQAMAITDLIKTLGWDYIATFHSENAADMAAYEAFKSVVNRTSNICISKSHSVKPLDVSDDTFNSLVSSFFQQLKPKVVVLFLPPDQLTSFFQAFARRVDPTAQDIQFIIGYRGLTKPDPSLINSIPAVTKSRLLGILPSSLGPNANRDFDDFFKALSPDNYDATANPWFKTFWQKAYQCNLDGGNDFPSNCSEQHVQQHMNSSRPHPHVPVVLDSIKVLTEALKMTHQTLCGEGASGVCANLQQLSADYFYSNITQVNTTGSANQQIQYKASGDLAVNRFSIIGFANGQEIGTWQDGNLTLPLTNLTQPLVNSTCGDTCLDIACIQNKDRLDQEIYIPGDIIIGGMFNIHPSANPNDPCGDVDEIGVHRLEAMLYALDQINNDPSLLPGIKFGMDGLDTCGNTKRAGSQALQLIANADFKQSGSGEREGAKGNAEHLFAVVGPERDDECVQVSEVLKVYHVPVVAYAAASATLSNSYFYPNFARVIAPATNQYAALLGAIFTNGWDYIQAIHSTSQYGYNGVSVLKQQAPQRKICLTQYMAMPSIESIHINSAWDDIFQKVNVRKDAKVLVIISDNIAEFKAVLDQMKRKNMIGSFYLFASDGWPLTDAQFYNQYANDIKGATFIGQLTRQYPDVKNYIGTLNPAQNTRNPWFAEYWMNKFDCYLPGTVNSTQTRPCSGDERINGTLVQDVHVADVVDAVYTVAYMMQQLQAIKCPGQVGLCTEMINTDGAEIFSLIRQVQFYSVNDRKLVKFDYQGNADNEFEVFNYQLNEASGVFENIKVGGYRTYTYTAQGYPSLKVYTSNGTELVNPVSVCIGVCADCKKVDKGKTAEAQYGDAYIGGFFRLHELDDNEHDCKDEMIFYNMQYIESFLYAIDEVNRDLTVLPNLKLGGVAFDTCGSPKRAQRDAANFISATVEYRYGYPQNRVVVSGVIGEQTSDVTLALADVVTPLQVPQISYAATTTVLDDNVTYPFFQRTVASDNFQADALLDILKQMNWKYVSVVYSDDEYGNDMYKLISEKKTSKDICVAMSTKISASYDMEGFKSVVRNLRGNPQANVVLLLTSDYDTRDLLLAAESLSITDLQWVGSDTWGSRDYVTAASPITSQGAITLEFKQMIDPGFSAYYSALNPYANIRNPWWKVFISEKYQCNLYGYDVVQRSEWTTCPWDVNTMLAEDPQEPEVSYIILAVKAFAQGLHDAMQELCPDKTDHLCTEVIGNMTVLQDKVRAAKVDYFSDGSTFQFDANGNGPAMYDILNYQKTDDGSATTYALVGSWTSNDGLSLDTNSIKFYDANGERDPANSECMGRCFECNPSSNPDSYLHIDGQLQIPGLFALHEAGDHLSECGDFRLSGLLNIEAMLYAIDMINNDPNILPGVTLGTTVFDTCLRSSRAVRDLSSLLSGSHVSVSTNQIWSSVIGVIGSESEDVTLSTAELTGQYKYTQISYGPGDTLTPSNAYLYRAGTFASDASKARAVIELLGHYSWTYVSVVYSSDDEDIVNDVKAFNEAATNAQLCIATQEMLGPNNTYPQVMDSILDKTLDNVVVAFLKMDDITSLQHQLVIRGGDVRHITWVLAYPYDLETNRFIIGGAGGSIRSFKGSLAIKAEETVPDNFKQYVTSLRVNNSTRNPWFKEYIDSTFNCGAPNTCDGSEGVSSDVIDVNGQLVESIIDSVKVVATGIDMLLKTKCPQAVSGMCAEFLSATPEEFRNAVKSYTFTREDGSFFGITDEENAIMPTFEVWNYQDIANNGNFEYVKVGYWQPGNLQIPDDGVTLYEGVEQTLQPGTPTSSCDDRSECGQCLPPTTAVMTTHLPPTTTMPTTVLRTTEKITTNQPTTTTMTTEQPTTTKATTPKPTPSKLPDKPNPTTEAKKPSKQPQVDVGSSELTSAWFYAVIVFAAIGLLITIALIVLVILRWKEPVTQAMSPFLLLMVLIGVFQMFTLVIVFAVPVSVPVCAIQRIDSGIGFAMCYAALFLMTVRLYRMGRHRTISGPKTSFIETGSQVILFLFLAAFQFVIDIEWLILEPPMLVPRDGGPTPKPGGTPLPVVGDCKYDTAHLQFSFIYIYILLVLNLGVALIARRRISHMVSMSHVQIDTILLANIGCIFVMIVWVLLGELIHADFHRLSISILAVLNGYIVLATVFLYRAKILFLNHDPFEDTMSSGVPDYGYGMKMDVPSNDFGNGSHVAFENPVATTELADFSNSDSKELIQ
ncbi:uncharacterized protein [Amphiura filiformis]|uniref:uncharacterized protein n=1 Tax=Amphiura filiformis TaxID=82378 RepID=UPI003B2212E9